MFTQPDDLDDVLLRRALRDGWGFDGSRLEYRPVGFGSHHWLAQSADGARLFATVDDLRSKRRHAGESTDAVFARLERAFQTVRALDLPFALGPIADRHGRVLARLAPSYSLVAHPFVEGGPIGPYGEYQDKEDLFAVLGMLVELHKATFRARRTALADDFAIPNRPTFQSLLARPGRPWNTGPFAARAQALLATTSHAVRRLLRVYDELVALVRQRSERFVITHGEPHPGNVLATDAGLLLIDWDTNLIAPPERDLWHMATTDGEVLDRYAEAAGAAIDHDAVTMYRLGWDLTEISLYVTLFAAPHTETRDTIQSWQSLNYYLQPEARWPELI